MAAPGHQGFQKAEASRGLSGARKDAGAERILRRIRGIGRDGAGASPPVLATGRAVPLPSRNQGPPWAEPPRANGPRLHLEVAAQADGLWRAAGEECSRSA